MIIIHTSTALMQTNLLIAYHDIQTPWNTVLHAISSSVTDANFFFNNPGRPRCWVEEDFDPQTYIYVSPAHNTVGRLGHILDYVYL